MGLFIPNVNTFLQHGGRFLMIEFQLQSSVEPLSRGVVMNLYDEDESIPTIVGYTQMDGGPKLEHYDLPVEYISAPSGTVLIEGGIRELKLLDGKVLSPNEATFFAREKMHGLSLHDSSTKMR